MSSEPEVMEYESVEDLKETIDEVYDRTERLNSEMETLTEQVQAFLNYEHDPEQLRSAAEYVSEHIPEEALPGIAKKYAREELENPEEADNWDRLEQAEEAAEGIGQGWRETYTGLWNEFGYSDEKLNDEIEGIPPIQHFLNTWENEPYRLFEEQESYDRWRLEMEAEGSRPTMARQFDIENPTSKQRDDSRRGKVLERENQDMDVPETFDEEPGFWRKIFSDRTEFSKWVNQEKLDEDRRKEAA